SSILFEVKPPTGEPDAGDPPVRFGGRGDRNQSALPTPIELLESRLRRDWIPGRASLARNNDFFLLPRVLQEAHSIRILKSMPVLAA
ncbi:MAG: hypothetical protein ABSF48_29955, partial [Thermodesulfobacteriota bacterium]